jgi:hypothetical protein
VFIKSIESQERSAGKYGPISEKEVKYFYTLMKQQSYKQQL